MTALALAPNGVQKPLLSNVIEEWFGNDFLMGNTIGMPKTNISEKDDHYLIELSVPGHQKKDFNIVLDKRLITVSNSVENSDKSDSNHYISKEFHKKKFSKSFSLPATIDSENISATCTDGILSLILPKREEAKSKPARSIEIK